MKSLEDYMKLNYRLEFEPDEEEGSVSRKHINS